MLGFVFDNLGSMSNDPSSPQVAGGADEAFLAHLDALTVGLQAVGHGLDRVSTDVLAAGAARAAAVMAAAEAMRAAIVLEARDRGVIANSDHRRLDRWVEQACRDAGVPVTPGQARQLHAIARSCTGYDLAALREAVTTGRIPLEAAALVATTFRRLRSKIEHGNWDILLATLIDWAAAGGAGNRDLATLEDLLIGQYGTPEALDEEHAGAHTRRELTAFHRDRHGMLRASLRLDPASEAVFTAAIHALSAPQPGADRKSGTSDDSDGLGTGVVDERTPGQRRADALLTLARLATTADAQAAGSGPAAIAVITMRYEDLLAWTANAQDRTANAQDRTANAQDRTANAQDTSEHHDDVASSAPAEEPDPPAAVPLVPPPDAPRPTTHADWGLHAGTGGGYAVTGYRQVLSPSEARMLACDAHIIPAVLGSHDEPLNLGRSTRLITPGQRRVLHLRDKGCTYPGCTMPPAWCDGHHVIHWAHHGPTDLTNLALLCRHHHTTVHKHHHAATITAAGVRWTRHDGTPIGNQHRRTPARTSGKEKPG